MNLALGTKITNYNINIVWNAKTTGVKNTGLAILGVLVSLGYYNKIPETEFLINK